MMRSVTECFIVLIRKGIGWLSLKRGCAAFTTTASIFLLSWSQLSNHPENSLEPELDKLLDNYYFGSYLEKKITQPLRVSNDSSILSKVRQKMYRQLKIDIDLQTILWHFLVQK